MCNNHILRVQKTHSVLLYKETLVQKDNFSKLAPIRYSKKTSTSLSETNLFCFLYYYFNLQSYNSAEIIQNKYQC